MNFLIIVGKVFIVLITLLGGLMGISIILTSIRKKKEFRGISVLSRILTFITGLLILSGVVWLFSVVF